MDVYSSNLKSENIASIRAGGELYKNRCSNCHGINAQGKNNGFFLSPNLTIFNKGYEEFMSILINGYTGSSLPYKELQDKIVTLLR